MKIQLWGGFIPEDSSPMLSGTDLHHGELPKKGKQVCGSVNLAETVTPGKPDSHFQDAVQFYSEVIFY